MRKAICVCAGMVLAAALCCSVKKETPVRREASPLEGRLAEFFNLCARDASSGARVVEKHDIVKMLTHFLRMDGGGKKYYLLEREHISEMILAVTEGLYSDFILINRHGVVVYSRENDEIFGKNVRTGLSESPLARCFAQQDRALHVEDVAVFPSGSGRYGIFISSRIEVENTFHGIFILQAGVEKVEGYLDAGTEIVDYEGRYRVTPRKELMLSDHPLRERMKPGVPGQFTDGAKKYESTPFEFNGIRWMIVGER
ncbi:MAG: hypothetical protein KBA15_08910 [Spirochaetes bacterium]|nr:hypothetical protein [Spirochaetota bacterium]